jgi:hypothetical protein
MIEPIDHHSSDGLSRVALNRRDHLKGVGTGVTGDRSVGFDLDFAEKISELVPVRGEALKSMFINEDFTYTTAFRNSSLQGAYLILAARALGARLPSDVGCR